MLLSPQKPAERTRSEVSTGIRLRCTQCGNLIGGLPGDHHVLTCSRCKMNMTCHRGVWQALLPEREAYFARFMGEYQFVRASEGRGSANDDYYLALPYRDLSGRNSGQWAIRARTFRYIERRILPRIITLARPKLRVLDLGAGNGWMSYRLAKQGHTPIAVDLLTNNQDGLEAAALCR
jgi:hypothetical protein